MRPLPLVAAALLLSWLVWRWRRRSNGQRAGGVLAVAALLAYGAGLVALPNVEKLIEDAGGTLGSWTYVLVGAMTFLETGAFLSFVAPGEFTILFGGLVAGQGEISVVVLIGIVWFCAVAGDTTSFYIGRRLGRDFLIKHGERVKITDERLQQVERFYERHGGVTVFIGRFVGLLRALGPFIAGASKMPYRRFLPYDVLGGGLWGTGLVLLGYVFWRSFDKLKTFVGQGFIALSVVIGVVVGVVWAVRFFRVPENRAKASAWLDEQERRPLARPFVRAGRRLLGGVVVPVGRRVAPPLRFLYERITPGNLGLELTTLLAIAAVGGFAYFGLGTLVTDAPPHDLDLDAFARANDLLASTGVDVARVLSALGSLPVAGAVVLAATAYLLVRGRLIEALTLLTGMAFTYAGVHLGKATVDRPRPLDPIVETMGSSFPSGHAAYAVAYVAVAVAILRAVPGIVRRTLLMVLALVLAVAVGVSRVYLRAHFVTDVAGGWGLAALCFSVCGIVALVVGFLRNNARERARPPSRPTARAAS
ncbi:MAG: VTT domain-containing protein [Solirubrobacteraceae bacterium]